MFGKLLRLAIYEVDTENRFMAFHFAIFLTKLKKGIKVHKRRLLHFRTSTAVDI